MSNTDIDELCQKFANMRLEEDKAMDELCEQFAKMSLAEPLSRLMDVEIDDLIADFEDVEMHTAVKAPMPVYAISMTTTTVYTVLAF